MHTPITSVEPMEANSWGTEWENIWSRLEQSAIMVEVRSLRSRFPKKDSGSLRSVSAKLTRRLALSR